MTFPVGPGVNAFRHRSVLLMTSGGIRPMRLVPSYISDMYRMVMASQHRQRNCTFGESGWDSRIAMVIPIAAMRSSRSSFRTTRKRFLRDAVRIEKSVKCSMALNSVCPSSYDQPRMLRMPRECSAYSRPVESYHRPHSLGPSAPSEDCTIARYSSANWGTGNSLP